jgi:hypothetical protein
MQLTTVIWHFLSENLSPPRLYFGIHANSRKRKHRRNRNSLESVFWNFDPKFKCKFLKVTWKICFDFFESKLKINPRKHWSESCLMSRWYFEVLVVKLKKTLFLNFILKKILRKKRKNLIIWSVVHFVITPN